MGKRGMQILLIAPVMMLIMTAGFYYLAARYVHNEIKAGITLAAWELTGRKPTLQGDMDLVLRRNPAIVVKEMTLKNEDWGSRPNMVRIERIEAEIGILSLLSKTPTVKRLLVTGPELSIETNEMGESNLHFFGAPEASRKPRAGIAKVLEDLPRLSLEEIVVEKGSVSYRDARSGKTHALALKRFTASASGAGGLIQVLLTGDLDHEPFEVKGTTGPVRILEDPHGAWPLNLTATALGVTATFKALLRAPFEPDGMNLDFIFQVSDLKSLPEPFGQPLPLDGPLEISGRGAWSGAETYRFSDLHIRLGDSRLSGSLKVRLERDRPVVSAELETDRLDLRPILDAYVKSERQESSAPGSGKSRKLFPDAPIPPVALKSSTVALTLKAGKVLLPDLIVDDLWANTTVTEKGMAVDRLSMRVGDAEVNGWLRVEPGAGKAKVAARLRSEGIDLAKLSREAGLKKKLGGRLSAEVEIKGSGTTLSGLLKGADGRVVLVMLAAHVDERYLNVLGADTETELFRMMNPFNGPGGDLEVDCMTADFDVRGGVARSRTLVMNSEDTVVIGEGSVDLGTESLDIDLKSYPRKGIGGITINPGGFLSSFKLVGTLGNPSLAFEPTDTVIAVGKAVGGFLLFGPAGLLAGMISDTKGADAVCIARP